jgi:hypothetical protein
MYFKLTRSFQAIAFGLALSAPLSWALASDHSSAPHVHGAAMLNLAIEGETVSIGLEMPAADVVGFEHAPKDSADRKKIADAAHRLGEGFDLFVFPTAAKCVLKTASVRSELMSDEHEKEHAGHKDHDDHGKKHDDHERHEEGEEHSEFDVSYTFECGDVRQITQTEIRLFKSFPTLEKLQTQFVTGSHQGGGTVSATNPVLKLSK